jgi:hypothetical protein
MPLGGVARKRTEPEPSVERDVRTFVVIDADTKLVPRGMPAHRLVRQDDPERPAEVDSPPGRSSPRMGHCLPTRSSGPSPSESMLPHPIPNLT